MRPEEQPLVLDLLEDVFGDSTLFARYMESDPLYDPGDVLIALDGACPVACAQVVEKRIHLAGEEVPLGMISSVATHPDYRRRGLAGRLLAGSEERLRERGMPLALLFTSKAGFYARHGWIKVPMDLAVLRRGIGPSAPDPSVTTRTFHEDDLEAVRTIYARQNAGRPGSTVRSVKYWRGQLRYAGTPGEQFRIAGRGGRVVAYTRFVERTGLYLMEHAHLLDEVPALVSLIFEQWPENRRLFIRSPLADLEAALLGAGATVRHMRDPAPMWRVLDKARLAALAGQGGDDETLITELIRKPRTACPLLALGPLLRVVPWRWYAEISTTIRSRDLPFRLTDLVLSLRWRRPRKGPYKEIGGGGRPAANVGELR